MTVNSSTIKENLLLQITIESEKILTASALTISRDPLCLSKYWDGLRLKKVDEETWEKKLACEDAKCFSLLKLLQIEQEYIKKLSVTGIKSVKGHVNRLFHVGFQTCLHLPLWKVTNSTKANLIKSFHHICERTHSQRRSSQQLVLVSLWM